MFEMGVFLCWEFFSRRLWPWHAAEYASVECLFFPYTKGGEERRWAGPPWPCFELPNDNRIPA